MLPADIPDDTTIRNLIERRSPGSVSLAVESSPFSAEHERVRIALRGALDEASRHLTGVDKRIRDAVLDRVRTAVDDADFWRHQSASMLILADASEALTFRLPFPVTPSVTVGDRFDVRALLAARGATPTTFVLQLSQGLVRLTEVTARGVSERALSLPDDLDSMLRYTTNDGRADREPARGSDGDGSMRARFCHAIDAAVVAVVPRGTPLILAATEELAGAYRTQNTHDRLLQTAIRVHPESLDDATLAEAARAILAERHDDEVTQWKERFGTLRAQNLATSRVSEVAAAAAAAAIEELRLDREAQRPGSVDEYGVVHADGGEFLLLDLAGEVLRTGGRVIAVPRSELTDGSPVAAILRYPVPAPTRA